MQHDEKCKQMCKFENEAMWVTNQSNAKNAGVREFEWLETESVAMWNVIFEKREKKVIFFCYVETKIAMQLNNV